MAIVNTRDLLHTYIRSTLGEPIITVEVSEFQIDNIIDSTIQKFSDYAAGGENYKLLLIPLTPGVLDYKLDDRVKAVMFVKLKSNGFTYQFPGGLVITPDNFFSMAFLPTGGMDVVTVAAIQSKVDMIQQYFDIEVDWDYNDNTKVISFYKDPAENGPHMLMKVMMEYVPQDTDMIYNHQWVKDYCVAKTRLQWGNNTGKYDATLINGSKINYADMKTEAIAEIKTLDDELLSKWSAPLGLYR
jgi:hypothetical protein